MADPANAALVLQKLTHVIKTLYPLTPPAEAPFEKDMIRLGFVPSRDDKTIIYRNDNGYNFYYEKKAIREDGITLADPTFIEKEFDMDAGRNGAIISNGTSATTIKGGGDMDKKEAAVIAIKEAFTKCIGSDVNDWSLKPYLYILGSQIAFGDVSMWIFTARVDPASHTLKMYAKPSTKITIKNATSFEIKHTIVVTPTATDSRTDADLPLCTIPCSIEAIVTEVPGSNPRIEFTYKWDLTAAYKSLNDKFNDYVTTNPPRSRTQRFLIKLIRAVADSKTNLPAEVQENFPPSVEKTSDKFEAIPRLIETYFDYDNSTTAPLLNYDLLRWGFNQFIKQTPPTSRSRRGVDLITKVDLQTEPLNEKILELFPASVLKIAKDNKKDIDIKNPQQAIKLLMNDYEASGTERGHYPYGSWAECLTPTCMITKDPLDKQLQDTREGNLAKSSEKALEDAVRAWATSKGSDAEKTRLLDYAIQRQRLLDDETKKRAIRAGNSSRNTLPLVATATVTATAASSSGTPPAAGGSPPPAGGGGGSPPTGGGGGGGPPSGGGGGPPSGGGGGPPSGGGGGGGGPPSGGAGGPPEDEEEEEKEDDEDKTPFAIPDVECVSFDLATFPPPLAMLSSTKSAAKTQPPLQEWLALTGGVVMQAFRELGSASTTYERLLPTLFKVGDPKSPNVKNAIFIAVCHQLYFAAQIQRNKNGLPPLPLISEGLGVWFPALQTEVRALKDSPYFGVEAAAWQSWYEGLIDKNPLVSPNIIIYIDNLKRTTAEIRTWLETPIAAGVGPEPIHDIDHILDKIIEEMDKYSTGVGTNLKKLNIIEFIQSKTTDQTLIDPFIEDLTERYHALTNATRATKATAADIYKLFTASTLSAFTKYDPTATTAIANNLATSWRQGTGLRLTLQQAVDAYESTLTKIVKLRSAGKASILRAVLALAKKGTPKKGKTTTRKNRRPT